MVTREDVFMKPGDMKKGDYGLVVIGGKEGEIKICASEEDGEPVADANGLFFIQSLYFLYNSDPDLLRKGGFHDMADHVERFRKAYRRSLKTMIANSPYSQAVEAEKGSEEKPSE